MSERGELAWLLVYNLCIVAAVAVVTLGGLALSGEWYGLWSLLLIFGFASKRSDKDSETSDTD